MTLAFPKAARAITPTTLRTWLADGQEIALIDVSEAGQFGEQHLLLASNFPYSRFEPALLDKVPRSGTRLVLTSFDGQLAPLAAARAVELGYQYVHWLEGGTHRWQQEGYKTFQGVNVPSKAFSEYVEHAFETRSVTAETLADLQQSGQDVVLLDSRTLEEHRKFHVPGAISCPGGEIVTRFADVVSSPDTLVVVTCAGRTRGIIGAQSLIDAGVPNRVVALAGGTQGWRLAGFDLHYGSGEETNSASPAAQKTARTRARELEKRAGLVRIDAGTLQAWQADPARTTYLFDIRSREEFENAPLADAVWAEGVQLIQCFDEHAVVRHARVVLVDDDGSRAVVVANWLHRLGAEVALFNPADGILPTTVSVSDTQPGTPDWERIPAINTRAASEWTSKGAILVDARSSERYLQSHARGAVWANRAAVSPALVEKIALAGRAVILADDNTVARLLGQTLQELTSKSGAQTNLAIVDGGFNAWERAGLEVVIERQALANHERIDYLFWLHDRHAGNLEASAAYLQWEADLPRQIGAASEAGFRLP
ncbi:sulfurtransferase [Advenella kashmirensis W13003]|uniref:Sulfurtransferase n=1 Tax=Advenella kashmirensis W13003 TaxID=1424334 RepID=V8QQ09_9BURK|nr:rhodanese-like domain-containing protein [Advenella kashmirensis]ETF01069.1 sulfurtransferase [Advenella kashmirensis W13003]